jgi:hypothetical protein
LAPNDKVLLRGYKEGKVIYVESIKNFSLKWGFVPHFFHWKIPYFYYSKLQFIF